MLKSQLRFSQPIICQLLPIKFRCFDVAEAVGVVWGQQEDVGRNELVVLHTDDVTDLKQNKPT